MAALPTLSGLATVLDRRGEGASARRWGALDLASPKGSGCRSADADSGGDRKAALVGGRLRRRRRGGACASGPVADARAAQPAASPPSAAVPLLDGRRTR
ncbi:hypothetical protein GCM10010346_25550 [Streptomyces chryseus]|uniref:Uncharacterized protein n=1 Tax=Streptomyces chryseus TaxID=68186 RepID=A0ABQ3DJR9_9ACTN|nr:hypothetical protein GCM10010346_25550 [Streptomyces chryseus]